MEIANCSVEMVNKHRADVTTKTSNSKRETRDFGEKRETNNNNQYAWRMRGSRAQTSKK